MNDKTSASNGRRVRPFLAQTTEKTKRNSTKTDINANEEELLTKIDITRNEMDHDNKKEMIIVPEHPPDNLPKGGKITPHRDTINSAKAEYDLTNEQNFFD